MAHLTVAIGFLGWAVACATGGCGSGASPDLSVPNGGGGDTSNGGTPQPTQTSQSQDPYDSGPSPYTAYDANAVPTDGAASSDDSGEPAGPTGMVACGAMTCKSTPNWTVASGGCCVAGGSTACTTDKCTGLHIGCDDQSDCTGNGSCCFANVLGSVLTGCSTTCESSPVAPGVKVCTSSKDCNDGDTCAAQTCFGYTLQICGGCPPG